MASIWPRVRCSRPQVTRCSTASKTFSQEVRNAAAVSFQERRRDRPARSATLPSRALFRVLFVCQPAARRLLAWARTSKRKGHPREDGLILRHLAPLPCLALKG